MQELLEAVTSIERDGSFLTAASGNSNRSTSPNLQRSQGASFSQERDSTYRECSGEVYQSAQLPSSQTEIAKSYPKIRRTRLIDQQPTGPINNPEDSDSESTDETWQVGRSVAATLNPISGIPLSLLLYNTKRVFGTKIPTHFLLFSIGVRTINQPIFAMDSEFEPGGAMCDLRDRVVKNPHSQWPPYPDLSNTGLKSRLPYLRDQPPEILQPAVENAATSTKPVRRKHIGFHPYLFPRFVRLAHVAPKVILENQFEAWEIFCPFLISIESDDNWPYFQHALANMRTEAWDTINGYFHPVTSADPVGPEFEHIADRFFRGEEVPEDKLIDTSKPLRSPSVFNISYNYGIRQEGLKTNPAADATLMLFLQDLEVCRELERYVTKNIMFGTADGLAGANVERHPRFMEFCEIVNVTLRILSTDDVDKSEGNTVCSLERLLSRLAGPSTVSDESPVATKKIFEGKQMGSKGPKKSNDPEKLTRSEEVKKPEKDLKNNQSNKKGRRKRKTPSAPQVSVNEDGGVLGNELPKARLSAAQPSGTETQHALKRDFFETRLNSESTRTAVNTAVSEIIPDSIPAAPCDLSVKNLEVPHSNYSTGLPSRTYEQPDTGDTHALVPISSKAGATVKEMPSTNSADTLTLKFSGTVPKSSKVSAPPSRLETSPSENISSLLATNSGSIFSQDKFEDNTGDVGNWTEVKSSKNRSRNQGRHGVTAQASQSGPNIVPIPIRQKSTALTPQASKPGLMTQNINVPAAANSATNLPRHTMDSHIGKPLASQGKKLHNNLLREFKESEYPILDPRAQPVTSSALVQTQRQDGGRGARESIDLKVRSGTTKEQDYKPANDKLSISDGMSCGPLSKDKNTQTTSSPSVTKKSKVTPAVSQDQNISPGLPSSVGQKSFPERQISSGGKQSPGHSASVKPRNGTPGSQAVISIDKTAASVKDVKEEKIPSYVRVQDQFEKNSDAVVLDRNKSSTTVSKGRRETKKTRTVNPVASDQNLSSNCQPLVQKSQRRNRDDDRKEFKLAKRMENQQIQDHSIAMELSYGRSMVQNTPESTVAALSQLSIQENPNTGFEQDAKADVGTLPPPEAISVILAASKEHPTQHIDNPQTEVPTNEVSLIEAELLGPRQQEVPPTAPELHVMAMISTSIGNNHEDADVETTMEIEMVQLSDHKSLVVTAVELTHTGAEDCLPDSGLPQADSEDIPAVECGHGHPQTNTEIKAKASRVNEKGHSSVVVKTEPFPVHFEVDDAGSPFKTPRGRSLSLHKRLPSFNSGSPSCRGWDEITVVGASPGTYRRVSIHGSEDFSPEADLVDVKSFVPFGASTLHPTTHHHPSPNQHALNISVTTQRPNLSARLTGQSTGVQDRPDSHQRASQNTPTHLQSIVDQYAMQNTVVSNFSASGPYATQNNNMLYPPTSSQNKDRPQAYQGLQTNTQIVANPAPSIQSSTNPFSGPACAIAAYDQPHSNSYYAVTPSDAQSDDALNLGNQNQPNLLKSRCSFCHLIYEPTAEYPAYFCPYCTPHGPFSYCSSTCLLADNYEHHKNGHCANYPQSERFGYVFNTTEKFRVENYPITPIVFTGNSSISAECSRQKAFSMYCRKGDGFPNLIRTWSIAKNVDVGSLRDFADMRKIIGNYYIFGSASNDQANHPPIEVICTITTPENTDFRVFFRRALNSCFLSPDRRVVHYLFRLIYNMLSDKLQVANHACYYMYAHNKQEVIEAFERQFQREFGDCSEAMIQVPFQFLQEWMQVEPVIMNLERNHPILNHWNEKR